MTSLAELAESRELLSNLTLRELRGRYKRSTLGWAWSMVNPLATLAIFTVVFNVILNVEAPVGDPSDLGNFALFLACALLPWTFLANGMTGSITSLISNANLVKKVYFPREVLVVSTVLAGDMTLLIELGVLVVLVLAFGAFVVPWLPLVLLLVVIQTLFVVGVSLALSVLNVYFRDVQHFVGILLQLWFYATPIVYPPYLIPLRGEVFGNDIPVRPLYELNPMAAFARCYRSVLYDLRFPPLHSLLYVTVVSLVTLAAGYAVFRRFEPRLAEEL